tara:strand:- start:49 stop:357 length:309 start_codon:yes stop_codon:yes gene_type:complete
MQLASLAASPQLKSIKIEDESIVEKYGESVEFFIHDRLPLDQYMELGEILSAKDTNYKDLVNIAKDLMLDEKGKSIITGDKVLPMDVALAAMTLVSQSLGNL